MLISSLNNKGEIYDASHPVMCKICVCLKPGNNLKQHTQWGGMPFQFNTYDWKILLKWPLQQMLIIYFLFPSHLILTNYLEPKILKLEESLYYENLLKTFSYE